MRFHIPDLRLDPHSLETISNIASYRPTGFGESIILNFRFCNWLDANICSPLGAVLYSHTLRGTSIRFENMRSEVESILRKNGFLALLAGELRTRDKWGTVIPYRRYNRSEEKSFPDYILRLSKSRGELKFNDQTREALFGVTLEVFNNAVYHSGSNAGIFVCGQYYPNRSTLRFAISDLGQGFSASIRNRYLRDVSELKAIKWAIKEGHSTRVDYPGGLGLYLLSDFIRRNDGNLSILSGDTYFNVITGESEKFTDAFPGASVLMEIRTDRETNILNPKRRSQVLEGIF